MTSWSKKEPTVTDLMNMMEEIAKRDTEVLKKNTENAKKDVSLQNLDLKEKKDSEKD